MLALHLCRHILRTTRFSEQQRGEMWSKMKGAGAYSVGVIIIVVAIGLTLDAVIGGGLFTVSCRVDFATCCTPRMCRIVVVHQPKPCKAFKGPAGLAGLDH